MPPVYGITTLSVKKRLKHALKIYRETGSVADVCKILHIGRGTLFSYLKKYPKFKEAWDEAREDFIDTLEKEAARRALEKSDTLLIFLLKGYRPYKFKENYSVEHKGTIERKYDINVTHYYEPLYGPISRGRLDEALELADSLHKDILGVGDNNGRD